MATDVDARRNLALIDSMALVVASIRACLEDQ
jgi:hypothetical protein